jgi:ABC-type transport system involved in cytochrome c biogenesis permease component
MLTAMMIVLEFFGMPTGLSGVLNEFGININPTTHQLINADIENSTFFSWIFGNAGIFILISGEAAVIVGLFAKSYDTSLVVLPIIISVATLFASTSWFIIKYAQSIGQDWITMLIATIFIPIGIGFIWSCVSYFAGRQE